MSQTACRFCGAPVEAVFADLGMSPLANSYLPPERANGMEPFYPLRALVCGNCFLVQLEADLVHVLVDGRIVATGDAALALQLEQTGYVGYQDKH